jgi:hypothetical protein
MKFKIGPFEDECEFSQDNNWIALREFSISYFQIRAIPIGILNMALFALLWARYTPITKLFGTVSFPFIIFQNLAILIGVLVTHELIHAFMHPNYGFSKQTVIRLWPAKMFVCAYYLGEITKNRSIIIQIMPLIIISIIPLIIAIITQISPIWLAYMSIVNALVACGDILAIIMTMRELPNGSIIRTTGWNGFYRIK